MSEREPFGNPEQLPVPAGSGEGRECKACGGKGTVTKYRRPPHMPGYPPIIGLSMYEAPCVECAVERFKAAVAPPPPPDGEEEIAQEAAERICGRDPDGRDIIAFRSARAGARKALRLRAEREGKPYKFAGMDRGVGIATPCPNCGSKSLFVGTGGHLTCSRSKCSEPSAETAVAALRSEAERLRGLLSRARPFVPASAATERGREAMKKLRREIDAALARKEGN